MTTDHRNKESSLTQDLSDVPLGCGPEGFVSEFADTLNALETLAGSYGNAEKRVVLRSAARIIMRLESKLGDANMRLSEVTDELAKVRAGCQCPACRVVKHDSDCAVHNMPAEPNGPCNCGAAASSEYAERLESLLRNAADELDRAEAHLTAQVLRDRTALAANPRQLSTSAEVQRQGADSPYVATIDPSADQAVPGPSNKTDSGGLQEATATPIAQSAPATHHTLSQDRCPHDVLTSSPTTANRCARCGKLMPCPPGFMEPKP